LTYQSYLIKEYRYLIKFNKFHVPEVLPTISISFMLRLSLAEIYIQVKNSITAERFD